VQDPSALVLLLVAALAVALVVVAVLSWSLRRARAVADHQREMARTNEAAAAREQARQVAARDRTARAVAGEKDAAALLVSAGYEVLARQVAGSWTVYADGEPRTFRLRADYLVSRGGRRLVAEVKTGRLAPDLAHGATRRQLLEYGAAFDVDGVLLVDADRETITRVEVDVFVARRAPQRGLAYRVVLVVAAVSFGAGVLAGVAMRR